MIIEPKYFRHKYGLALLLLPISLAYIVGDFINRLLTPAYRSRARVICVGNLTIGGVGKTPIVMKIVERLLKEKTRVGVLSRGYGGRLSGMRPVMLDIKKHTALEVGDEPFLIASKFPKVPVCICANRARGAKLLEQRVDVIVMDDGLQNYSLEKDVKISVFDGRAAMGNGYVLPAGPLRQLPGTCLRGIDACVIMSESNAALAIRLSRYTRDIFDARAIARFDFKKLGKKPVIAFAGIGRPHKFYRMLEENGLNLVKWHSFLDHHRYSGRELAFLLREADRRKAALLTTMKDFVKIPDKLKGRFTPIDIGVQIDGEDRFMRLLAK